MVMYEEGKLRILELMKRAERGDEINLAFFGGSITQGSLASDPSLCYAFRVFDWWRNAFPKASFHYINAGIGGTSSHFGAARVWEDLLCYRPDFVVVDFSVNDEPDDFYMETYEGVVRRIFLSESAPAMLLLNNIYYDSGKTCEEQHVRIGDYYGIPHVSIRDTVYRRMKDGLYTQEELTPDGLHPNDFGHGLLAEEIVRVLMEIRDGLSLREDTESEIDAGAVAPAHTDSAVKNCKTAALTPNRFEYTKRLTIRNSMPVLAGFRADPEEKAGHLDFFKNGWIGRKTGESVRFTLPPLTSLAIQYRKTVRHPAPKAICILNGDREHAVLLDADFSEDWGDCLFLQPIPIPEYKAVNTVEVEITEAAEECAETFYLLSVIYTADTCENMENNASRPD